MESKWIVSSSGYSIKTDDDEGRIVTAYPASLEIPLRRARFEKWIEDAENICILHNRHINTPD